MFSQPTPMMFNPYIPTMPPSQLPPSQPMQTPPKPLTPAPIHYHALRLNHALLLHLNTPTPLLLRAVYPNLVETSSPLPRALPENMASTSMNTGNRMLNFTTTRRSMGSLFHVPFAPLLSLRKLDIEGCDPLKLPGGGLDVPATQQSMAAETGLGP